MQPPQIYIYFPVSCIYSFLHYSRMTTGKWEQPVGITVIKFKSLGQVLLHPIIIMIKQIKVTELIF